MTKSDINIRNKKASFEFNANNKDLLEQDLLFRLQWNYDTDVVKEINKQLNEISNSKSKARKCRNRK